MVTLGLLTAAFLAEPVHFVTQGSAHPRFAIFPESSLQPLAQCAGRCSYELPHGKYRVILAPMGNTYAYEDVVSVSGRTYVKIAAGDRVTRRTLMAVGSALLVGIPIALFGLIGVNGNSHPGIAAAGGVMIAGSIGFFIGASSCKPSIYAYRF